jgi:hypothetical protein
VHTDIVEVRGGLVGWLFGVLVVRPVLDAHVRLHMAVASTGHLAVLRGADGRVDEDFGS